MHLRHMQTYARDSALAEFHQSFPDLRQVEELGALLIDVGALLHARLGAQVVIVAQASFVQQVIDHLTAMAAEIVSIVHAVLIRAAITAVVAIDLGQLIDLHAANRRRLKAKATDGCQRAQG